MEQLNYNLLFRWFVGLSMDAPVWNASTFSKNRERLLEGDVARQFLAAIISQPRIKALMSDEHFSDDGTLIQAWASQKSFQPRMCLAGRNQRPGRGRPNSAGSNVSAGASR
jgi:transposase